MLRKDALYIMCAAQCSEPMRKEAFWPAMILKGLSAGWKAAKGLKNISRFKGAMRGAKTALNSAKGISQADMALKIGKNVNRMNVAAGKLKNARQAMTTAQKFNRTMGAVKRGFGTANNIMGAAFTPMMMYSMVAPQPGMEDIQMDSGMAAQAGYDPSAIPGAGNNAAYNASPYAGSNASVASYRG